MNKFKVGDRVWRYGYKCKIIEKCGSNVKIKDMDGNVYAIRIRFIKPIIKIKNGVVYE